MHEVEHAAHRLEALVADDAGVHRVVRDLLGDGLRVELGDHALGLFLRHARALLAAGANQAPGDDRVDRGLVELLTGDRAGVRRVEGLLSSDDLRLGRPLGLRVRTARLRFLRAGGLLGLLLLLVRLLRLAGLVLDAHGRAATRARCLDGLRLRGGDQESGGREEGQSGLDHVWIRFWVEVRTRDDRTAPRVEQVRCRSATRPIVQRAAPRSASTRVAKRVIASATGPGRSSWG